MKNEVYLNCSEECKHKYAKLVLAVTVTVSDRKNVKLIMILSLDRNPFENFVKATDFSQKYVRTHLQFWGFRNPFDSICHMFYELLFKNS